MDFCYFKLFVFQIRTGRLIFLQQEYMPAAFLPYYIFSLKYLVWQSSAILPEMQRAISLTVDVLAHQNNSLVALKVTDLKEIKAL